jgi:hypothetical protein
MYTKCYKEKDYLYIFSVTVNSIKHPKQATGKTPFPRSNYLWIKFSLARRDYIKDTSKGGKKMVIT